MHQQIQTLLDRFKVTVESFSHEEELGAFCPFTDTIFLNYVNIMLEPERKNEIILHELIHWTGHNERLNRSTVIAFKESTKVSTKDESTEEVTAQLGMEKLAIALGLDAALHRWLRLRYVAQWPLADLEKADRDSDEAVAFLLASN